MSRMNFEIVDPPPTRRRGGSTLRFLAWTALVVVLTFWGTLTLLG